MSIFFCSALRTQYSVLSTQKDSKKRLVPFFITGQQTKKRQSEHRKHPDRRIVLVIRH